MLSKTIKYFAQHAVDAWRQLLPHPLNLRTDSVQRYRRRSLWIVALVWLGFLLLGAVSSMQAPSSQSQPLAVSLTALTFVLLTLYLNWRGNSRTAAFIFCLSIYVVSLLALRNVALFNDDVMSRFGLTLGLGFLASVATLLAGMLLGGWESLLFATLYTILFLPFLRQFAPDLTIGMLGFLGTFQWILATLAWLYERMFSAAFAQLLEAKVQAERAERERLYFDQLSKLKDDMLAVVSHDLKNPISTILMSTHLLARRLEDDDTKGQRMVMRVESSARQMQQLLTDLLDMVQLDAGMTLRRERVEVQPFMRALAVDFERISAENNLQFTLILPDKPVYAQWDVTRMRQVWHNLFANALKFTMSGSIKLIATVTQTKVIIKVQDTGVGIPDEQLSHIFDKFYRVDNGRYAATEGNGLGLAIARTIIEQHQGNITVQSVVAEGTQFMVTLPRAVE